MTAKATVQVGDRFGPWPEGLPSRWQVVSLDAPKTYNQRSVLARCDCGTERVMNLNSLRTGNSRSCGCLRSELVTEWNKDAKQTHGLRQHPLYATWIAIRQRCLNPENPGWAGYGGRGITICTRWDSLELFIADIESEIGPRPPGKYDSGRPLYSLDRKDNDGNYEPGNVQWATAPEQARNQRSVHVLSARVRELETKNSELEEENRQLKAQLAALHQRYRIGR